jgi:hypothetical protein
MQWNGRIERRKRGKGERGAGIVRLLGLRRGWEVMTVRDAGTGNGSCASDPSRSNIHGEWGTSNTSAESTLGKVQSESWDYLKGLSKHPTHASTYEINILEIAAIIELDVSIANPL